MARGSYRGIDYWIIQARTSEGWRWTVPPRQRKRIISEYLAQRTRRYPSSGSRSIWPPQRLVTSVSRWAAASLRPAQCFALAPFARHLALYFGIIGVGGGQTAAPTWGRRGRY